MSSYQTVTLVTASPPPPVNHPRSSRVWGPSSVGTLPSTGLAYQISTLYLIIFGASWGPEKWCHSRRTLPRGGGKLASNKTSQAQRIVITAMSDVMVVLMCDTRHMVTMPCDQYRISDVPLIPPTIFMQSGADPAQEAHSLSGDISSL